MRNKRNISRYLLALAVLAAGYVLCRYVLFDLHGMREWPSVLFAAGILVLALSFLAKAKGVPLAVAIGYTAAFAVGAVFQTNGTDPSGGRTNTLWILWTAAYIGITLAAAAVEIITAKINK